MPKELISYLDQLDFIILEQELDTKVLTYNQLRMIFSYFWDYPVQLYPQVDFVILSKLKSGISPLILQVELTDPFFWDYYVSMDS